MKPVVSSIHASNLLDPSRKLTACPATGVRRPCNQRQCADQETQGRHGHQGSGVEQTGGEQDIPAIAIKSGKAPR